MAANASASSQAGASATAPTTTALTTPVINILEEKTLLPAAFSESEPKEALSPLIEELVLKCRNEKMKSLKALIKDVKAHYKTSYNVNNLRVNSKKDEAITELLNFFCKEVISSKLRTCTDKYLQTVIKFLNKELESVQEQPCKSISAIKVKPLKPALIEEIVNGLIRLIIKKSKKPEPTDKKRPRPSISTSSSSSLSPTQSSLPGSASLTSSSSFNSQGASSSSSANGSDTLQSPLKKQRSEDPSTKLALLLNSFNKETFLYSEIANQLIFETSSHINGERTIIDSLTKQKEVAERMKHLLEERVSIIEDLGRHTRDELLSIENQLKSLTASPPSSTAAAQPQ